MSGVVHNGAKVLHRLGQRRPRDRKRPVLEHLDRVQVLVAVEPAHDEPFARRNLDRRREFPGRGHRERLGDPLADVVIQTVALVRPLTRAVVTAAHHDLVPVAQGHVADRSGRKGAHLAGNPAVEVHGFGVVQVVDRIRGGNPRRHHNPQPVDLNRRPGRGHRERRGGGLERAVGVGSAGYFPVKARLGGTLRVE